MNSFMENAYSGMTFEEWEELHQDLDSDRLQEEYALMQEIELLQQLYQGVVASVFVAHQIRDIVLSNDLISMSNAIHRLQQKIEVLL